MHTSCTAAGVATTKPAKQNLMLIVLDPAVYGFGLVAKLWAYEVQFWLTAAVLSYHLKDPRCNTTDPSATREAVAD